MDHQTQLKVVWTVGFAGIALYDLEFVEIDSFEEPELLLGIVE